MSARIVVTLILEYAGNDTAEYDAAMEEARDLVESIGADMTLDYKAVRVVDVQVSG